MKNLRLVTVVLVTLILGAGSLPFGWAQEGAPIPSFSVSSQNDKLHAFDMTRFHVISLKQFHSVIFAANNYKGFFSEGDARILNIGLNAFLSSDKGKRFC